MKTKLPKRSLSIAPRLEAITKVILDVAKDKIAMIILFGSYARGEWVEDESTARHITYTYQSDLDIMLVIKNKYATGHEGIRIKEKIRKVLERLKLKGVFYPGNFRGNPPVTLILESIEKVNKGLEKGHYFYTDIQKEGVMLYNTEEFQLSEPKVLTFDEWKKIALDDYNDWFPMGCEFLIGCKNYVERGVFKIAAFLLHQATENFYTAILLVFSGYKPKTHALQELKDMVNQYDQELLKVFPLLSSEQEKCFELLKEAYVRARYDKTYKITKGQLLYLIERVEKLQVITETICLRKLSGK